MEDDDKTKEQPAGEIVERDAECYIARPADLGQFVEVVKALTRRRETAAG